MLKILYSSASFVSFDYLKQTAKSIGGLPTNVQVSKGINRLFGTVAMSDLSGGSETYRCVFLKNDSESQEIQNLELYVDILLDTLGEGFDPQTLTPVDGDKYIVPVNAINEWEGYDGKIAMWNDMESVWKFTFDNFFNFEFAKEIPADITVNDQLYEQSQVQIVNDIYDSPYGIDFVPANTDVNKLSIGNIQAGKQVALWIKRIVEKYLVQLIDFNVAGINIDEGGIVLGNGQTVVLKFSYILKTSYQFVLDDSYSVNVSTPLVINTEMKTNEIGEEGYTNLRCNVLFKKDNIIVGSGIDMDVVFMGDTYNNVQSLEYFGLVGGFLAGISFNESANITLSFNSAGVYDIDIDIVDLLNDENILYTGNMHVIVS